jgi:ubiquinone/menaquinone biosynthesis C-methylase UbiE
MPDPEYLMESDAEALRLDLKTDAKTLEEQAVWAGIRPGMRVADIGCGSGKTTFHLHKLTQPNGRTMGIDSSAQRLDYASRHYSADGLEYVNRNFCEPLNDLGSFDFVWMRFILEYFRSQSFDIVKNVSTIVKPGGILCLIDLDCNCMRHFGLGERLEKAIAGAMTMLENNANFDPYVGVKLYSYLYDLNFKAIDVRISPHNLTFGNLKGAAAFNWAHKLEFAAKNSGYAFDEYRDGFEGFSEEFRREFADPRRFHYSPLIACRGEKPSP